VWQVKIRNWIRGTEQPEVVGVGARFGKVISNHEKETHNIPLAKLDPEDACTDSNKTVRPYNLEMQVFILFLCIILTPQGSKIDLA